MSVFRVPVYLLVFSINLAPNLRLFLAVCDILRRLEKAKHTVASEGESK